MWHVIIAERTPKQKHDNFRQLSADDQRRVAQLAAILRIAGGLDRSHTQQVSNVSLQLEHDGDDHSVSKVSLLAHSRENPEVDLWGARRRAEMFTEIFDCELEVHWAEEAPTNGRPGHKNCAPRHAGEAK